jgi:thiamine phosphate synthase YjbQ (UPF0047 family)
MKTHTEYFSFHTTTHRAYVHITPQVEEIVRKSGESNPGGSHLPTAWM